MHTFPLDSAELDRCGRRLGDLKIYRTDLTNGSPTFGFEIRFSDLTKRDWLRIMELCIVWNMLKNDLDASCQQVD